MQNTSVRVGRDVIGDFMPVTNELLNKILCLPLLLAQNGLSGSLHMQQERH